MKFLLIALLGITTAFAQSEPVTRIKGDNDTSFKIAPNLKVPYKQATKINSTTARIETGNGNMLPDPSFESGVLPPTGTPSNVGDIQFNCNAYGTNAIVTSSISNDGTKAFKMTFGQGSGAFEGVCSFNTVLPSNLAGTPIEWSFEGALKNDVRICISSFQISPSLSQAESCYEFNEVGGINKRYVIPYTPLYNRLALTFKRINNTDTSTVREAELDFYYMGKPKSDEAIVAKFDNTTGWKDFNQASAFANATFITTTGTIESKWRRNGPNLEITFRASGTTVAPAAAPLTLDLSVVAGETITPMAFSASTYKMVNGRGSRLAGANSYTKNVIGLVKQSDSKLYFNYLEQVDTNNPILPANANQIVQTTVGLDFTFSIPIAEWSSQTNAAIVACKEGPLKCNNVFVARVAPGGTVLSENVDWINGNCTITNTSTYTCNFNSGAFVASPPVCTITTSNDTSDGFNVGAYLRQYPTTSSLAFRTINESNAGANANSYNEIHCIKTGSDYNEAYDRIVIQKDNADIRSAEWLTGGFNYIDNKPIYKKCGKVNSDIGVTSGTTILTTSANVIPLGHWYYNSTASLYYSVLERTTSNSGLLRFAPTTGVLSYFSDAGTYQLKAGQIICLEYLKP